MTRPRSHGGGGAGAPIAGDPESFPSDAELARTLVAMHRSATLSTLTSDGFPYGSMVSYATDDQGAPVVLISEMAEHTVNVRGDARVSLLVTDAGGEGDPLGRARLTLVGTMEEAAADGVQAHYLEAHPYASGYVAFSDFRFWRLSIASARYVGGFGHMSWITGQAYSAAHVDPVAGGVPAALEHINEDHGDTNLLYVRKLAGLPDATSAEMTGLDRYGVTLRAETPAGPRRARVGFPQPLHAEADIRPAVVSLAAAARAASGDEGPTT